ncbi:MAG: hydroxymethylbilane synthase [Gammaproteobacteria bacterium RIFCSPHIGHO2_02_FULL_39_13]|nr:MAG: hydroxymethylbilane synthase [Gammaproteobacteria bacterium RIFCSPHIGHO2_02_FULL_39_13]OGT48349.1 MAG: hydroxymethylbilane synthase [Gammaproteobacteria bacterium RIFCSPHIGHO2_12_FULL_39_24]
MVTDAKCQQTPTKIKIATRKSKLALWQANFVKSLLEKKYSDITVELIGVVTEGDQQSTIPLADVGGKALFVKALQNALLSNEADIAVHSMKDMSVFPTEKLMIAAICERADARDAFVSNDYSEIESLPLNAIVGTASPRRSCLLQSIRPDVRIALLRGNVDTRVAKLDAKRFDAIILAAAGLHRLDLSSRIQSYLSDDIFIPAIGQGAIAIECRESDAQLQERLSFLHHDITAQCVKAERMINQIMGGDCHSAIGAHAKIIKNKMHIAAMVGSVDGKIILREQAECEVNDAVQCAETVAKNLLSQGAEKLLRA